MHPTAFVVLDPIVEAAPKSAHAWLSLRPAPPLYVVPRTCLAARTRRRTGSIPCTRNCIAAALPEDSTDENDQTRPPDSKRRQLRRVATRFGGAPHAPAAPIALALWITCRPTQRARRRVGGREARTRAAEGYSAVLPSTEWRIGRNLHGDSGLARANQKVGVCRRTEWIAHLPVPSRPHSEQSQCGSRQELRKGGTTRSAMSCSFAGA